MICHVRVARWMGLGVLLLLLLVVTSAQPAMPVAVTLDVIYPQVSVQLRNTTRWLPLADSSVMPLVAGDRVRTDNDGRALLTLSNGGQLLLLPDSLYVLEIAEQSGETSRQFDGRLSGVGIQQIFTGTDYRLETLYFSAVTTGATFAVWSDSSEADSITVAEGEVAVRSNDERLTLAANSGYRYRGDEPDDVQQFDVPLNRARLIGELDGCPGIVVTRPETSGVLVRTGAGTGYQRRGLIQDDVQLPLLARTQSGFWTRIQYKNSFGWIISDAVETDCTLPVLPDDTAENDLLRVINVDERELPLLRPFFGAPADDPWFYATADDP